MSTAPTAQERAHQARNLAAIAVSLVIASSIAWAGSQGSIDVAGASLFALCGAFAFLVNWLGFVPAYLYQTERYYDLTGSLTYLAIVATILLVRGTEDPRTTLIAVLVAIWALRLGPFLFLRIRADGSDGRFDAIKRNFLWFLMTWTLQGLWVFLTLSCGLAAMTSIDVRPLGGVAAAGFVLWVVGFAVEAVADHQKRRFRADPANDGRFITSGLWAWSRHPNYFGEILLWVGIAVIAVPALSGWQYATLISPIFVFVLLTRISGVPLLEARGRKRWGDDEAYRAYVRTTPSLIPRPPRLG